MQPLDGHVQTLVDHLCCDGSSSLCKVAQALSALLNQFTVVDAQLVQEDWNKLVNIMDDLGLS